MALRFPELAKRIRVIEHGHGEQMTRGAAPASRSPVAASPAAESAGPGSTLAQLNVAVIGGLEFHKGLMVLRALLRANRDDRIVFHLYGTTPDVELHRHTPARETRVDGSRFVYHGPYDSSEIADRLVADGMHVGLQLAIWPETFSYTLSEYVASGIPVVAGDLGAQGERVRRPPSGLGRSGHPGRLGDRRDSDLSARQPGATRRRARRNGPHGGAAATGTHVG
jgi:hypothetical protein